MEPRSKVSAVTVNWNNPDDTVECLHSLRSSMPNMDLIVVDNGSSDDSVAVIKREVPQVDILEMGENLGYVKGINAGIIEALARDSTHVLIINNDATVTDTLVEELLDSMDRNREAGLVGPKILYHGTNRIWYGGGKFNETWGFSTHPAMDEEDSVHEEKNTDFVTGCVMLVHTDVFK